MQTLFTAAAALASVTLVSAAANEVRMPGHALFFLL